MTLPYEIPVSMEVAILLDKAGYDKMAHCDYVTAHNNEDYAYGWLIDTRYAPQTQKERECGGYDIAFGVETVAAPNLSDAQRWLREDKGLHIEVQILSITGGELCWYTKCYELKQHNGVYDSVDFLFYTRSSYDTYEEAQDAGLKLCLEYLLGKEK